MIDTVKMYCVINKDIYDTIRYNSIVKTSYNLSTGEIYYNIINDHLKGSYDSSLSVRVNIGDKYRLLDKYVVEVEGSYHKVLKGYNSHDGFYDLIEVCSGLIKLVENGYAIKLPSLDNWFLNRVDIAICFDLCDNKSVIRYIDNLRKCDYPRRKNKSKDYRYGLYYPGSVTTLKIYNKYLEFRQHDLKKLRNTDFNFDNYFKIINGFVRFEVEIKKRKLVDIYRKVYEKEVRNVKVLDFNYDNLKEVWKCEFMKLLKMYENELKIVRKKDDVKVRLNTLYGITRGNNLYNFYLRLINDGKDVVQNEVSKTTFYRNTALLSSAGIDFSQKLDVDLDSELVDFNPFDWKEVV